MDLHLIKSRLEYNPETGVFTWRNGRRAGLRAGGTNSRGYRHIRLGRGLDLKEHRLAVLLMTGNWPREVVDHVNRNPSDNRWQNLRCCSQQENMANTGDRPWIGVHLRRDTGKWEAKAMLRGKRVQIGCFETKEAAIAARELFFKKKARGFL